MAVGYYFCHDPRLMDQIFNEIRNDGLYISTCGDHKVQYVRDLTTGFDNSQPHNRAVLPVSSAAHMITFTFENECVATFRGSGTEPKLKYYIEVANASNEQLATDLLDSMKQEIIDRFLQPSQNGLRPPAAAEDAHNSPHNSGNSPEQMAPARIARDVIQKEIRALQNLEATLGRDFEKVVDIIESRGSGRVIFTGVGKSGTDQPRVRRVWCAACLVVSCRLTLAVWCSIDRYYRTEDQRVVLVAGHLVVLRARH